MNPFAVLRLSEVRELLRTKKISPVEVMRAYRRQADKVNPSVNALVADRWDQAHLEAKDLEKKILAGENVPQLAGLPFTAKELFEAKAMPHTLGVERRREIKGKTNATSIDRLVEAGGIFAGLTNVPEMGLWFETYNVIYGRTNNPYDLRRTAGGSSGGEAAIITAMGSAFGLGSDIGGSIRIPASFCGLFGHKPTRFIVPFTGHYPMTGGNEGRFSGDGSRITVVGPMARFADDLIELFQIIARPDGIDTDVRERRFDFRPLSWKGSWKGRKVFTMKDPHIRWAYPADAEIKNAVDRTAHFFAEQGAIVEELNPAMLNDAFEIWNDACALINGPSFSDSIGLDRPAQLGMSLFKMLTGQADMTLPILMYAASEKYFRSLLRPGQFQHRIASLRSYFSDILGSENILLMPTHPRTAFLHYSGKMRPMDFVYTAVWNALDFPVTQAPTGFDAQGLPMGIQIIANRWNDDISLLAARDIEKAFGGWRPPNV
jgi:fatty acid amide hydrolase 2